jgi:hypothetical protein
MAGLLVWHPVLAHRPGSQRKILDQINWSACEESTSDGSICMVQRLCFGVATFCSEGYDKTESCDVVVHERVREVRDAAQKLCVFATMVIPSKIESIIFLHIQITAVTYPFQIFLRLIRS